MAFTVRQMALFSGSSYKDNMKGTEGDKLLCAATNTVMFSTVREDDEMDNPDYINIEFIHFLQG